MGGREMEHRTRKEAKCRDAYPRLNLLTVIPATGRGLTVCRFTDNRGFTVGQAAIVDTSDEFARLAFLISGQGLPYGVGEVDLPIEQVASRTDPDRHYFRCLGCRKRKAILIWKESWRCGKCHKLHYRRQLISKEVALAERLTELKKEIGKGKPIGMHQETYAIGRGELDSLEEWFGERVLPVSSSEHDYAISGTWVAPASLTEGLWIRGYMIRGGMLTKEPDGWLD